MSTESYFRAATRWLAILACSVGCGGRQEPGGAHEADLLGAVVEARTKEREDAQASRALLWRLLARGVRRSHGRCWRAGSGRA